MDTRIPFRLDVVSDTICPWCWIGKRRLDTALAGLDDDVDLEVRWRPFELNPDVPREGMTRRDYRVRKFGSWERSLELDAQVREAGAQDGLEFRHALQSRTPNTLASHALVALAPPGALQSSVIEALFGAYFTHGQDVGDVDTLVELGTGCGLDAAAIEAAVTDETTLAALHAEAVGYARGGVNGVPSVLLEGFTLFSGAQPPATIEAVLREATGHAEVVGARDRRIAAAADG